MNGNVPFNQRFKKVFFLYFYCMLSSFVVIIIAMVTKHCVQHIWAFGLFVVSVSGVLKVYVG